MLSITLGEIDLYKLDKPIMTKFLNNKIESSQESWQDYLLEIAQIFSEFDGEEFNRDLLGERFQVINDRSPSKLRDPSNFRDEFGAYGSYLGVFHIEEHGGKWIILLSQAARMFLCSSEPDVEAFCRTQLSLFQYPNGCGATCLTRKDGSLYYFTQRNILSDTVKEVQQRVRLVPFRLILSALLVKEQILEKPPNQVELTFSDVFTLFNDPRTNSNPSPMLDNIAKVLIDVEKEVPKWVTPKHLNKFKRNFHILDHTGLIKRTHQGLALNLDSFDKREMIESIVAMTTFFDAYERCYQKEKSTTEDVMRVIESPKWGRYYDSANLPAHLVAKLVGATSIPSYVEQQNYSSKISLVREDTPAFPTLTIYRASDNRQKKTVDNDSGHYADPELTRVYREKANRDHARIVERIACLARLKGIEPQSNMYIDLLIKSNVTCIFEAKSCTQRNLLSQVRKGISQLYEYRYRLGDKSAVLCLVLQEPPSSEPWIVEYLINDRKIHVMWLIDNVTFDCPPETSQALSFILD